VLHRYQRQAEAGPAAPALADPARRVDGLTRGDACEKYQRKIVLIARRLHERLPSDCALTLEDMVSYGAIGLLEAFDRYDDARGIQFNTFAEYRIRGAMLDALRNTDTFTRRRRQLARRIQDATHELTTVFGHPPSPEEVAERLGMDLESYWAAVDRTTPISIVSLEEARSNDGDDDGRPLAEVIFGARGEEVLHTLVQEDARTALKEAIMELPERKRQCVLLYYGRDLSLAEIAEVFGVTPSRISQVLKEARGDLRHTLEGKVAVTDLAPVEAS
jgi:RNA polymerase sigma factor for flagellar operon FliA